MCISCCVPWKLQHTCIDLNITLLFWCVCVCAGRESICVHVWHFTVFMCLSWTICVGDKERVRVRLHVYIWFSYGDSVWVCVCEGVFDKYSVFISMSRRARWGQRDGFPLVGRLRMECNNTRWGPQHLIHWITNSIGPRASINTNPIFISLW